jgi:hypothetical protein
MLCRRLFALACFVIAACSSSHGDDPAAKGQLVVGVQAETLGPFVVPVHIVVKLDGVVSSDQHVNLPDGLPKEIALEGAPGAKVDVEVTGSGPQDPPNSPPSISRLASARLVAGVKKLLRVMLEERCETANTPGAPPPLVTCTAPQTCISGRCASGDVPDAQLEDYDPAWASAPPDICRPAQHGPPEVVAGTGQTDYAPLQDDQTLQMELGPQGGHHIWVATRMKNLRQSGSTTTITATVEGATDPILPSAFVFTYDQDEGAYCKLYGLRFQLDAGAADLKNAYRVFLGKTIDLTVTVKDSTGASASSTKRVHLGDTLICPDGTQTCNQ